MQDERSWKAVQAAIDFGEGRINADDLSAAAAAASSSASASASDSSAAAARNSNQLATADICRKHIGELIVKKVNEILKTNDLNT